MAFQQSHHQNRINVNGRIRAREVRVIIASTKEQLGVMRTSDALRRAIQLGVDLVEIAPNANPPVCQIVDFGKYRYELAKQDKERKQSTSKVKEIKFRVNIDEHDYMTKLRHAEDFLDKGNKVKVHLQFRGREMAHQEFGDRLVRRVRDDLVDIGVVESEPKRAGRAINMTLCPLPANKRKRRFTPMTEAEIEAAEAAEAAEAKASAKEDARDDAKEAAQKVETQAAKNAETTAQEKANSTNVVEGENAQTVDNDSQPNEKTESTKEFSQSLQNAE